MYRKLVTGLFALALIVTGCAASSEDGGQDATGDDEVVSGVRCTQTLNAQNQHTAEIEARGTTLTIKQSSTNGRFAPLSYRISRVMLMAAPSGNPKFECNSGRTQIAVWEQFARVGPAYYKLSDAPAESAGIECSKVLNAANQHTVTMKFDGEDELTVLQTSTNGRFAPRNLSLSRVILATAPAGTPEFECSKPGADITLWASFARVNGAYYKTAAR